MNETDLSVQTALDDGCTRKTKRNLIYGGKNTMRTKHSVKSMLSGLLATVITAGALPAVSVSAAQVNEYIDPADVWITSNGRTNELDFNATITQETCWCPVCNKDTINLTYRTPEYTKSGSTALNRGVQYSDGTMTDGVTKGNVDDGRPGVDATYSTYHWTKSVCQICGTINSVDGEGAYSFGKNVYSLNSCDHDFFLDFDNMTYTPYDSEYHTTILKKGQYCQFCKGTLARATEKREAHNFDETIVSEIGNQRFHITSECADCGYTKNEYAAAKSVVQSYYGFVDGSAHTVTVSDLSDSGVHTSIRYGTAADNCNKTSAPNYTEAGYYPVYYEIDYSYDGESMTENGVSYVWLLAAESESNSTLATETVHTHDYRYLETVRPTCTELGYDRFQCSECGALQKTNYTPATGHDYNKIVVREATCQQGGLELNMCIDKDNSDEDGHSNVGDYNILITDKDNKPIFDSKISIDTNDNLTIVLPDGILLSAEDITTITVIDTRTQQAARGINIFIADTKNNAATDKTDDNGQLRVPNTQSSAYRRRRFC